MLALVAKSGFLQLVPMEVGRDPDSNPKFLEMWRPLQAFFLEHASTKRVTEVVLLLDWAGRLFQRHLLLAPLECEACSGVYIHCSAYFSITVQSNCSANIPKPL